MPEVKKKPIVKKVDASSRVYKIRIGFLFGVYVSLLREINSVLSFFSLRRQVQFWGVVYDSVSKQPLDPVIVKLLYADTNQTETCVTDLNGRYGFLVHPGKFKIFAKKTNYSFPSVRVQGDSDGIYSQLYHGEFFELHGSEDEVLAPNIPMDPEAVDWNQQAKMKVTQDYPYLKYFFLRVVAVFFWFGFVYSGVYVWAHWSSPVLGILALGLYACIFVFRLLTPPVRLWGKLSGLPDFHGTVLELHQPLFPSMVFGKAEVRSDGKFFLRANSGSYELVLKRTEELETKELARCVVRVMDERVVNSHVIVKKTASV